MMRVAALFALGDVLGLNALEGRAEVVCNTEQIRGPGDLSGA
jgi:hypothetical protein